MKYILAIDQGTTSSRAILYNENLAIVGTGQQAFPQHFPQPSWVEHDLGELWNSVELSIKAAIQSVSDPAFDVQKIVALGITNQRETFGLWERASSEPAGRAIVWQCRRSAEICAKLKKSGKAKTLEKITGLKVDPYFSGTKLHWWLESNSSLYKRAQAGELAFGTMDSFLMWKLSCGDIHATDVSNASRTMLMDLKTLEWSEAALKILKVPAELLPRIEASDAVFGVTRGLGYLPDNIPICGVLGDQQAALFGQACFGVGEAKITYGTGAFFLINTGAKIRRTKSGLSTVAWRVGGKTVYALEGSVFIAGAAVQWLRDGLKLFHTSSEIEILAAECSDSDGVFFIPALSGLGAPYWVPEAKGLLGGLTRRSTKAHVARACLEGIAHSVADTFGQLVVDSKSRLKRLKVDGGASMNELLLQAQADYLQCVVARPRDIESTARGAASLAALTIGILSTQKELEQKNPLDVEVKPKMKSAESKKLRSIWQRRVKALIGGAY